MPAADFEVLRRQMLAEISAATVHVSGLIGKAALDERVMTAMGKDPRHEFVPAMPHKFAIGDNVRFHPGAGRAIDGTNRTSESPKGITGHAFGG
jgi:protein-L-isoaspartate(D-aspartate) O-methyltransferase